MKDRVGALCETAPVGSARSHLQLAIEYINDPTGGTMPYFHATWVPTE